jgi:hypothetical protein
MGLGEIVCRFLRVVILAEISKRVRGDAGVTEQESAVREIRMLRSTRRGLETWHGRDGVTLARERASQQEHRWPGRCPFGRRRC